MVTALFLEAQDVSPLVEPQCSCAEDAGSQHLLCMEFHVFVFCIIISAVASGLVVASKSILESLNSALDCSTYVHKPLRHRNASKPPSTRDTSRTTVQAAESSVHAVEGILERQDTVPARYVRAFCGNEKHAWERWKSTLAWRKENDIDSILNEPQPFFHEIRRYFPSYMSGRNRGGHIVVYEKLGEVDMRALRDLGITVPMLLRHWIFVSEYMYRVLQPTDSAQQVTIEDMKGVKIQSLAGKVQDYIRGAAQLARLYYVERCHKTYVVNAPSWFGLAFGIVSPFLSARTRQKIRILGSDLSVLRDEIDPQFLPVEYGGNNTVPVQDSAEERHLRRLVSSIDSKAERANGRKHGTPARHVRTPSRTHRRASPVSEGRVGRLHGDRSSPPERLSSQEGRDRTIASSERRARRRPMRVPECLPPSVLADFAFASPDTSLGKASWTPPEGIDKESTVARSKDKEVHDEYDNWTWRGERSSEEQGASGVNPSTEESPSFDKRGFRLLKRRERGLELGSSVSQVQDKPRGRKEGERSNGYYIRHDSGDVEVSPDDCVYCRQSFADETQMETSSRASPHVPRNASDTDGATVHRRKPDASGPSTMVDTRNLEGNGRDLQLRYRRRNTFDMNRSWDVASAAREGNHGLDSSRSGMELPISRSAPSRFPNWNLGGMPRAKKLDSSEDFNGVVNLDLPDAMPMETT